MAFPTNGLLDQFSYSDGDLSTLNATDWATPIVSGDSDILISSNQIGYQSAGQMASAYWKTSLGPDCEIYITQPVVESSGGDHFSLFARVTNPNSGSMAGYEIDVRPDSGEVYLEKWASGSRSELEAYATYVLAAGDAIGMEVVTSGSDVIITVYKKLAAGSWEVLQTHDAQNSYTDTAPGSTYTGQGYLGLRGNYWGYFGGRLDDFGGGTIGGAPPSPEITPDAAAQVLTGLVPIKGFGIYVPTSKKLGT